MKVTMCDACGRVIAEYSYQGGSQKHSKITYCSETKSGWSARTVLKGELNSSLSHIRTSGRAAPYQTRWEKVRV